MLRYRVLFVALLLAPFAVASDESDPEGPLLADCNGNGIEDAFDIQSGFSPDLNDNSTPDSCETCQTDLGFAGPGNLRLWICGDDLLAPFTVATVMLEGAAPGSLLFLVISFTANPSPFKGGTLVPMPPTLLLTGIPAPSDGRFFFGIGGGGRLPVPLVFQYVAVNESVFEMSNAVEAVIGFAP